ncbi:MAG: phage baseplate protein [Blastocatellia bacterium]
MQALSASELLAVWERARAQSLTTQALELLAAVSPDSSWDDLEKLSVGRRDAQLLTLREALFGSRLTAVALCPQCGQQLELGFDAAEIRVDRELSLEPLTVTTGGYVARFRLPNSKDLETIGERDEMQTDSSAMSRRLLSRCLLEIQNKGRRPAPETLRDLPPALIADITAEMEKADPQANVELDLSCADCGHRWLSTFDIVSFLWSEIDNWAGRILREVCALSSAFGWRESDILAMSAQRRQLYLEMIGSAVRQ